MVIGKIEIKFSWNWRNVPMQNEDNSSFRACMTAGIHPSGLDQTTVWGRRTRVSTDVGIDCAAGGVGTS